MGLLLILPILVSGFICCHIHPLYFLKLHRYEGQYLYLQTAKLGFYCLAIAIPFQIFFLWVCDWNIHLPTISNYPNYIELLKEWLSDHSIVKAEKAYGTAWIISTSVIMIGVSPIYLKYQFRFIQWFSSGVWDKELTDVIILSELVKDSPLDSALWSAILNDQPLMLDMSDRKVYVCKISTMGEPNENQGADQEIVIVPILSGYRDKDTLKVTFTTKYEELNVNSALILKQENIVSIRDFDIDVWEKFNPEESTLTKIGKGLYKKIDKLFF